MLYIICSNLIKLYKIAEIALKLLINILDSFNQETNLPPPPASLFHVFNNLNKILLRCLLNVKLAISITYTGETF